MEVLEVTCSCEQKMKTPVSSLGSEIPCPKCGDSVEVTGENSETIADSSSGGSSKRLMGELLLDAGLVSPRAIADALEQQAESGGKLVAILISKDYLNEDAFASFLARQPGIASIDVSAYQIPKETVALVPRDYALRHEVFPVDKLGKVLTLGMACPLDGSTISELEDSTGLRIRPVLSSPESIQLAIRKAYPEFFEEYYDGGLGLGHTKHVHSTSGQGMPAVAKRRGTGAGSQKMEDLVEAPQTPDEIERHVRGLARLPVFHGTVSHLKRIMFDKKTTIHSVVNVLLNDPAATAQVLREANDESYKFPRHVETLELAITMMGLRDTFSLVHDLPTIHMTNEPDEVMNVRDFWAASINCAIGSRMIAEARGFEDENTFFYAGLLHGIGRLALAQVVPAEYRVATLQTRSEDQVESDLVSAEQTAMGIDHLRAGHALAQGWGLPEDVAAAILHHRKPDHVIVSSSPDYVGSERALTVAVVSISKAMANAKQEHGSKAKVTDAMMNPLETCISVLGMNEETVREVMSHFFSLPVPDAGHVT